MSVEHWRLKEDMYNLRGERRELEDGSFQYKLNGSNTWAESPNGHHQNENPLAGSKIIPQEYKKAIDNGRSSLKTHSSVEVST